MSKPLYKYLPLKYAKKIVNEGIVKIGTFVEYKNVEKFGKEIGDSNEGKLSEWSNDKNVKTKQEELNRIENQCLRIGQCQVFSVNSHQGFILNGFHESDYAAIL